MNKKINYEEWYKPNSGMWGERYLDEHKKILTSQRTKKEINIILKYVKPEYKSVLDAPCGFGRISIPLIEKGYTVSGVDLDPVFINNLKSRINKKENKDNFVVGDLRKLSYQNKFDLVLNLFTSIGYLKTDDENAVIINKLCEATKNGGRLIFELINPLGILSNYLSHDEQITPSGIKILYDRVYDSKSSINTENMTYEYPDGSIFYAGSKIRLYYPHELIKICEKKGMKLINLLDYDGLKYTTKSYRMWLIFEKTNV